MFWRFWNYPNFEEKKTRKLNEPYEVLTAEDKELQDRDKIPAQRMMQLLQLGFSFEDMKTVGNSKDQSSFSLGEAAKNRSANNAARILLWGHDNGALFVFTKDQRPLDKFFYISKPESEINI